MNDFTQHKLRDLRLTMLKSLKAQHDRTANEKILQLEAKAFGLNYPRDVIRNELRFLERAQAVKISEPGSVLVATLKQRGEDHLERLIELEGVDAPSLEG
jgi:pyridoxine/pyridoxamine 5'-phosphate oxidase